MKKSKAIIVTALLSVLFLCCLACCWALDLRAPVLIVVGLLACCGLWHVIRSLCTWLIGEADLEIPEVVGEIGEIPNFKIDYETIRDEIRKEARA